ncbi:uncharacterized protein N7459_005041 [Penicillium hispanicum]|uniref:uncharacterized protein n=1 Tax=Penicillium hispanicum TaxID=1080232 RepID=UPI0025410A52|nr:uncharacterized protein N7459_005041 [Penicillium hispanicum]KAJ5585241.1 hypothetical protein N7459_005041 [Penicillium hispanicum]
MVISYNRGGERHHEKGKFLTSIFLRIDAYIIIRTLAGRPKYLLWKISVLVLCLPGSFGMANEAE